MNDEKLSPHFLLSELLRTENRSQIEANRQVTPEQIRKLRVLAVTLLEPVRMQWGPVTVHSGYRNPALNLIVTRTEKNPKGNPNSQHLLCEAADFHVVGHADQMGLLDVFNWIWKESKLPFSQVILECGIWIHIAVLSDRFKQAGRGGEVLVYENGDYRRMK